MSDQTAPAATTGSPPPLGEGLGEGSFPLSPRERG